MCDLRNIQKIFRGTTPVQRVCVGNRVIWPVEQYTYRVDEFRLDYSTDDRILRATAVNSVRIAATLYTTDRAGHTSSSTVYVSSPVARQGGEFYTVSSDGSISFNRREYGTTIVDPEILETPVYYGSFTDPSGRVWDSGDFEIPFEGNLEYTDIISASVSVSLDKSQVACNTTAVIATPSFSRTYKYRYTSTDETLPRTDNAGTASIYFCPSTDPLEDGSYIGDASNGQSITVSFDHYTNLNNDTSKFYAVRAAYSGKEARTQIEQLDDPRDSAIVTPVDGSYVVDVMAKSDDISARGGSARYGVLAHHEENVVIKYHFGGDTYYSGRRTAYDSVSYAISGTADAQSRYHSISFSGDIFAISHYNMEKRGESADDITVAFSNESHTSATASVSFQPRNTKTTVAAHYGNTVGITVGLSRDYLDCKGGNVTVSGTRRREWYAEAHSWTSGESEGGGMTYKDESITSWTSITVSPTATVSGTTITIGERKHNTSSQVFTVTGKADGKTATATVERLGDSTYSGTKYTGSHYLRVEGALNTISAAGGSRKYDISAGHTLVTPTYWRSDDELYSEVTEQVRDKWKYTKSDAGQSHYKNFNVTAGTESSAEYLSFDHDNMAKREETDTISISIVSAFDSTQTFAETLAPANKVETSTPETTTAFEANNLVGIAAAGQSNIQITGTRTFKTAYKKWTSGAEEGGATDYTAVNASSVTVNATTYTWLHAVSGGKLTVDAYTATDADRTGAFSATYDGKTDSNVTITQKAREKQPAEYISFYYEPQSQYLNYLYIKNNSDRAIDVNSFYYVMDGATTTSSALGMHAGESRLVRGWNPNVSHLTDYGVTDATWH